MAEEKQDAQKTIVAFVVGLLIGGMLVWAFSGPSDNTNKDAENKTGDETTDVVNNDDDTKDAEDNSNDATDTPPTLSVGEGNVDINDQPAGTTVGLSGAVYPVSE